MDNSQINTDDDDDRAQEDGTSSDDDDDDNSHTSRHIFLSNEDIDKCLYVTNINWRRKFSVSEQQANSRVFFFYWKQQSLTISTTLTKSKTKEHISAIDDCTSHSQTYDEQIFLRTRERRRRRRVAFLNASKRVFPINRSVRLFFDNTRG